MHSAGVTPDLTIHLRSLLYLTCNVKYTYIVAMYPWYTRKNAFNFAWVRFLWCVEAIIYTYVCSAGVSNSRLYNSLTLRKLVFHFLSDWMGYDRGYSFHFKFEPNGIPFGSKSKENCHHDHIPFNLKGKGNIVFSV